MDPTESGFHLRKAREQLFGEGKGAFVWGGQGGICLGMARGHLFGEGKGAFAIPRF